MLFLHILIKKFLDYIYYFGIIIYFINVSYIRWFLVGMMNYKFAMIDLDGTLLKNRSLILETNLKSIKIYKHQGGDVVITTGRWPISAFEFNKTIEKYAGIKNKYLVALNGALIYEESIDNLIFEKSIDNDIFKELISSSLKFKVPFWIYSKEGILNKTISTYRIPFKFIISKFNYGKLINYKFDDLTVYKILFISLNARKINKLYEFLSVKFLDNLQVIRTTSHSIEVTAFGVDKGTALKFIANKENIEYKNFVVFGDSGNDVSMFKIAGLKISLNFKNTQLVEHSNVVVKQYTGVSDGIMNYVLKDINFSQNKILVLDFSKLSYSVISETDFIKFLYFWTYLLSKKPIVIISKYSLNDNLIMFKEIIKLNNNILIYSGEGTSVYYCKTKKIIKKSCLSTTQMVALQDFLLDSLENENVSILVNQLSGPNIFLSKNPNNFVDFVKNSEFNENNFTIIEKDFQKYINAKSCKFTNINIIGLGVLPSTLNVNSLNVNTRGSVISISNREIFLESQESINNEIFNIKDSILFNVENLILNKDKLFESLDEILKKQFL